MKCRTLTLRQTIQDAFIIKNYLQLLDYTAEETDIFNTSICEHGNMASSVPNFLASHAFARESSWIALSLLRNSGGMFYRVQ